jgi:hypothetical protein
MPFFPGAGSSGVKIGEPNYDIYQTDATHYYAIKLSDGTQLGPYSEIGALFNALVAVMTTGGTIFVRDGTSVYTISTQATFSRDNMILCGEGNAIIKSNFGATVTIPIYWTGANGTIENMIFDGNSPTDTGISPMVEMRGASARFINNTVQNCKQYGLEFYYTTRAVCAFNTFKTCQYGITVSKSGSNLSSEIDIIANQLYDINEYAIKLRGVRGCQVIGNEIDLADPTWGDHNTGGICCYHGDGACIDTTILANFIEDTLGNGTGPAIQVSNDAGDTARRISILNNKIYQAGMGILSAWKDVDISGNTILGRASATGGIRVSVAKNTIMNNKLYACGIELYDGAVQCRVESNFVTGGNQYYKVGGDGISVWTEPAAAVCDQNIIKDNQIDTVTGWGIQLYYEASWVRPTNTRIEGNILTNCSSGKINDLGTNTLASDREYNGASDSVLLNNGTAEYFPVEAVKAKSTTESQHVIEVLRPCVVTKMHVKLSAAPAGAGKSYTISLRKNGGTVTPAVTITNTETEGTWTGCYALAAGDLINFISNGGVSTPTASIPRCELEVCYT